MRKEVDRNVASQHCRMSRGDLFEEVTFNVKPLASCAKGEMSASGGGYCKCKDPEVGLKSRQNLFLNPS